MARMVPVPGSLARGRSRELFRMPGADGLQFAVLICFEDTLSHHVRKYVRPALGLLVNITNDGWFKRTAAPWQHLSAARLRTVETRLPMVRSANTGVSCLIDRTGRLLHVFRDGGEDDTFAAGTAAWELIPSRLDAAGLTFYTRHGDWFAAAASAVALLAAGWGAIVHCRARGRERGARRGGEAET